MSDLASELGVGSGGSEVPSEAAVGAVERECVFFSLDKGEFPETWPQKADIEVALVNLLGEEEIELARVAQGNQSVFLIEGAKRALVMWNGEKIDKGPGLDEMLWEKMGSRCRNIIAGQFAQLWSGSAEGSKKAKDTFRRSKIRL